MRGAASASTVADMETRKPSARIARALRRLRNARISDDEIAAALGLRDGRAVAYWRHGVTPRARTADALVSLSASCGRDSPVIATRIRAGSRR